VPYSASLAAIGGVSSRTWSVESGLLPPGLTLSSSGSITGTPTIPARADFVARVSDNSGSATQSLALNIAPVGGFESDPDLILHYTFDEGSGSRVWDIATGGNNHATDVTGAHWISDGRLGGAYGPGDASATINRFFPANQSDLNFDPRGDAFTISLWVRTTATSGYNTILGKDRDGSPFDTQYRLWMPNNGSTLEVINGGLYSGGLNVSAPPMNNGQWHLITLVNYLSGATWRTRVYYDHGTQLADYPTGIGGTIPGLMRLGDTTRGGSPWRGQFDDFRVYRRALSQSEIQTLYAASDTETYDDWWLANLSPEQRANAAINGPHHDANGNGVSNLMEFALGSASLEPLSLNLIGTPGNRSAQLTHTRNSLARGHTLIVECSTDLVTWVPLATSINGTAPAGSATISESAGTVRTVEVLSPVGSQPTFYRLRVTLMP
jgi:hypothetical protein